MNTQQFTISPIPDDIFAKMQGKSFKDNCTVPREDLRYLKVLHVGFDGKTHGDERAAVYEELQQILAASFFITI